jgi:hypothetical protein
MEVFGTGSQRVSHGFNARWENCGASRSLGAFAPARDL